MSDQRFKDTEGRGWSIRLDVQGVRDVRADLGVDLLDVAADRDFLTKLASDPVLLVDVIFVLCRDQAEKADVTDEQFGRALAGDAIYHATNALISAIIDFFPNAQRREALGKAWEMVKAADNRLAAMATERMPAMQKKLDEAIASVFDQIESGSTSSDVPQSSG